MFTDCRLYVSTCKTCNTQKKPCRKARAKLGQCHAGVPFERIHIDILGPSSTTKQGNKYILVIIDQFTKWLEWYPLPSQNAETIANALMDSTISRFGCPLELHSDQGKNVDGNLIRQLCNLLEISKIRTTAYHAASNGQVEGYNRLILQIIRCFLKNTQHKWDVHLQQLAGAIRSTENRQTRQTPNFLLFGREVSQPLDLLLGGQNTMKKTKI
jgi:transposase InsO family protein